MTISLGLSLVHSYQPNSHHCFMPGEFSSWISGLPPLLWDIHCQPLLLSCTPLHSHAPHMSSSLTHLPSSPPSLLPSCRSTDYSFWSLSFPSQSSISLTAHIYALCLHRAFSGQAYPFSTSNSLMLYVRGWHHFLSHLLICCLKLILRLFQVCMFFSLQSDGISILEQ